MSMSNDCPTGNTQCVPGTSLACHNCRQRKDPAGQVDPSTMTVEQINAENKNRAAFNKSMGNIDPVPLIPIPE